MSNAEEVMEGFPNSKHLILEGLSHSGGDTPEIREKIKEIYLEFMKGNPLPTTRLVQPFKFEIPD